MYVPHAWLYRGLRSEGRSRTWTEFFTFEEKVKNIALYLCTYPWPVVSVCHSIGFRSWCVQCQGNICYIMSLAIVLHQFYFVLTLFTPVAGVPSSPLIRTIICQDDFEKKMSES